MVDAIRYMLDQIESTDLTGDKDFSQLVHALTRWSGELEQPDESPLEFPLPGAPSAVSHLALASAASGHEQRSLPSSPASSHSTPTVAENNALQDNESSEAKNAPFQEEHVLGEVTFSGKTTGLVHIHFPGSAVPLIGHRLLGLTPEDLNDPVLAADVTGEICNMIVGNFKSNLCDAGLNCKLHPPTITSTREVKLHRVSGGTSERYGFRSKEFDFLVDLSVNPWVDQQK